MSQQLKSVIQYTIIGLIGVLFLYFVFRETNWIDLVAAFHQTNYWWIAAGMGISLVSHVIRAIRANMLYDVLGYKVSVKNSFYAVMVGYMMNYIIPRAGEVSRCASLLKSDDVPVAKSLGTVVTERIFDVVILFVMLGVVVLMQFDLINGFIQERLQNQDQSSGLFSLKYVLIIGFVIAVGLVFALRKKLLQLAFVQKIWGLLKNFSDGLLSVRKVKHPVLFALLSVLIWFCYLLMMYFCLFSMEATAHLSFMDCLTVFVIGSLGMIIPAPGAGAGTYHFAVMQSLLLFNVAQTDGIAYATIVHGVQMVLLMAIGAICSLLVLAIKKKKQDLA